MAIVVSWNLGSQVQTLLGNMRPPLGTHAGGPVTKRSIRCDIRLEIFNTIQFRFTFLDLTCYRKPWQPSTGWSLLKWGRLKHNSDRNEMNLSYDHMIMWTDGHMNILSMPIWSYEHVIIWSSDVIIWLYDHMSYDHMIIWPSGHVRSHFGSSSHRVLCAL